jgi:hypothetical protein
MTTILTPKTRSVDIRQDGERVLIVEKGRTILDLPWDAAQGLARGILAQAGKAEEIAKAAGIAFDQAVLMRAGANIGLTSNASIQELAANEAAWNSKLRKYMPGGVKSREKFGRPDVKHQTLGASGIPSGEKFGQVGG